MRYHTPECIARLINTVAALRITTALTLFLLLSMTADAQNITPSRQVLQSSWQFRQAHTGDWKPTAVPGSVHTALLANKMIEDPYYRDNEEKLQWIEQEDWEFETTFNIDPAVFAKKHIELIFNGLDTYAHIYLNDSLILETDNMFRTWKVDIKKVAKESGNKLHIYFESPTKKTAEDWKNLGYELPGGQRVMTRKAQFHSGWDWGPRLVGCGILKTPELLGWDDFKFEEVFFTTMELTPEKARVVARFKYTSEFKGKVTVLTRMDPGRSIDDRMFSIGTHEDSVWFDIENPILWWSAGMGDQHLYDFGLDVKRANKTIEQYSARVGLRTIELVTQPDEHGESFYFKLNGKKVFARGANYIPQDMLQDRVKGDDYKRLIDDAVASNMNMLRVWGGGIYEDETFYQLCDAKGILVWQDFMYACALYPGNGKFLKNAAAEAYGQIVRLRQHPCIALWCGNNENSEAWNHWGWQMKFTEAQRKQLWRDYEILFHDVLQTYVNNYSGNVPYWESSPRYGRFDKKSNTEGDAHYWGVWHDEEPFSAFDKKVPRFMSEYGFQSFPEWRTIESFTKPEDRELESKVMLAHQKHPRGNALIAEYARRDFKLPKKFEDFVYVSQLVQAEGMRVGIEAHRRNKPYCMGTLYWQFNDVWPGASWSSRDCFGHWKALQYYVRDAYSPIAVLPKMEDDSLHISVVNDSGKDAKANLHVRVIDFSGKVVFEDKLMNVRLDADSSHLVWQKAVKEMVGKKTDHTVMDITLRTPNDSTILHRRLFYFESPKDLSLPKAKIDVQVSGSEKGYELTLTCDNLAKNVLLSADTDGFFSDNYFDLLPGESKKVVFRTKMTPDGKPVAFSAKSLVEVGK